MRIASQRSQTNGVSRLTDTSPDSFNLDAYGGLGYTYRDKPILGLDGVINQIDSGAHLSTSNSIVTYSFLDLDHLTGLYNNPTVGFSAAAGLSPFSEAQREAARDAIQLWDDLIPLSFRETDSLGSDIQFSNSLDPAQAYAYYPTKQGWKFQSDVFVADPAVNGTNNWFSFGGYGTTTLVHEIGHAIGESHPGDYNYDPALDLTYDNYAEYAQDSEQYTIMSYWYGDETGNSSINWTEFQFNSAQTPMLHDVLTIQSIYGADTTTRTGATTYGFNSNAGNAVFDFSQNPFPYLTIYDAGGTDTIDLSGFTASNFIDLHAGSFSSVGQAVPTASVINAARAALSEVLGFQLGNVSQQQVNSVVNSRMNYAEDSIEAQTGVSGIRATNFDTLSIAYGTVIENASGGSARDLIWGNEVANVLRGNGGDDVLNGFQGADTLYGGSGRDTFAFSYIESGDRIADFSRGDKIDLRGTGVDMTFIGSAAFSGVAGQLRYAQGYLTADVNGDGTADLSIQLSGSPTLNSGDLFLL